MENRLRILSAWCELVRQHGQMQGIVEHRICSDPLCGRQLGPTLSAASYDFFCWCSSHANLVAPGFDPTVPKDSSSILSTREDVLQ
ncbi:hypothetical protein TorRG33x02_315640 [Trema orientale]|uniref:Uncharacterized protein n=1 Tax=Trema orientale TaxID=63057 RepID=A0A2P5BMW8_TREOI|nr:hypothetical protein TorRG33x02_315640 [Trema orientale]